MASAAAASSFATGAAPVSRARGRVRARAARAARVRAAVSEPTTPDASVSAPAPRTTDQVFVDALAPGVSSVRCVCRERLKFEVEYGMQRGSTDNSYVVVGERATALLDLPDKSFAQAFADTIDCASLDFIVLGHLSPKRLDSLAAVLEARPADAPALEVWCSNPAAQVIYQALKPGTPASNEALTGAWKGEKGLRARLRTVRTGDSLDLGGRGLDFVTAPTPRWPDAVVTYDTASKFLFTSKLFSAHVATDAARPTDADASDGFEEYLADWRYFFDCMLAPMARPASAALDKLAPYLSGVSSSPGAAGSAEKETKPATKSVAPKLTKWLMGAASKYAGGGSVATLAAPPATAAAAVAPLHGPVVRAARNELAREYREWVDTQIAKADDFSIAVIYASAYGNTSAMAQAIARGITKAGVAVEMLNCELSTVEDVATLIAKTDGFCLGAPTLGGHMPTPVSNALGVIVKEASREYPAGVFGSFGWSGEAVDLMESRLKDGGFSFAFDAVRCKFKPTEATLQVCEESGTDLAQAVKKLRRKKQTAETKALASGGAAAGQSDTAAAVGRIVGSLCAVTAKKGDAQSAMLASWVSQASFNPPALTVAVAKERAVESFLLKGATFNLNVLQQGNEKDTIKALLKPFAPGENRFGDMAVDISDTNGCAIVTQALSYMECEVEERMECGDHWVVLAKVRDGKLLQDEGLTAIHHRKTGTSY
jgi:flavorubredoxin/flavin reductase (DIM6/NTAB) family NADH-FMN oxidoreductase RutF